MMALYDADAARAARAPGFDVIGSDMSPAITCSTTRGTLIVLTDTRTTYGCPGAPDSEELLLDSVLLWMHSVGRDLPCAVMQMGFDTTGHPRLVLAVEHTVDAMRIGLGEHPVPEPIRADVLPCTVVVLTDITETAHGSGVIPHHDCDVGLVAEIRQLLSAHPEFTCEAFQMGYDQTGRARLVLAGEGWTAA